MNVMQVIFDDLELRLRYENGDDLNLSYYGITDLKGFKMTGNTNLSNNKIKSLCGFDQTHKLDVSYNRITNVDGLRNGAELNASNNLICTLEGFTQNFYCDFSYNKITCIDNLLSKSGIDLSHNKIKQIKRIDFDYFTNLSFNPIEKILESNFCDVMLCKYKIYHIEVPLSEVNNCLGDTIKIFIGDVGMRPIEWNNIIESGKELLGYKRGTEIYKDIVNAYEIYKVYFVRQRK